MKDFSLLAVYVSSFNMVVVEIRVLQEEEKTDKYFEVDQRR